MRTAARASSPPSSRTPGDSELLGSHWLGVDDTQTEGAGGARVDGERVQPLDPLGLALDELGLVCGPPEHAQAWAVRLTASGRGYARIWLVNLLAVVLTAGLALPWARARSLRYFHAHTLVAGHPLGFHGEPGAMLGGGLLAAVLLGCGAAALVWGPPGWAGVAAASFAFALLAATVPALVQAALQGRLARTSWRDMPLQFAGTPGGAARVLAAPLLGAWACATVALALPVAEAQDPQAVRGLWLALGALLLTGALGAPAMAWQFLRWRQTHLAIGPLQAQWKATLRMAYGLALRALLALAPAGLLAAAAAALALAATGWMEPPSWLAGASAPLPGGAAGAAAPGMAGGTAHDPAHGLAADLVANLAADLTTRLASLLQHPPAALAAAAALAAGAWLVSVGLALPWAQAALQNLVWGKTGNRYVRIRSRLSPAGYVALRLRHGLLTLATLGLYAPWAAVAARRMRLQALTVVSRVVPDDLAATLRQVGDTRPGGDLFGLDLGW